MRVDRLASPVLSATAIDHDLKVKVWRVLRGVSRRADEAKDITFADNHALGEAVLIPIKVSVIVDEALVGIELVDRDAPGFILPQLEDRAAVGGNHGCATRGHDVHGIVAATTARRAVRVANA